MPRYVRNVETAKVHDADCDYAQNARTLPWPRWRLGPAVACRRCLPQGLPALETLLQVPHGRTFQ